MTDTHAKLKMPPAALTDLRSVKKGNLWMEGQHWPSDDKSSNGHLARCVENGKILQVFKIEFFFTLEHQNGQEKQY